MNYINFITSVAVTFLVFIVIAPICPGEVRPSDHDK